MTTPATWIAGARPRTLPAAIVPVAVGVAAAWREGDPAAAHGGADAAAWGRAALALGVSLALQVGVNYANDHADGVRGTDEARVGPVRLVGSGLASPAAVRRAAILALGVGVACGAVLSALTSWWLVAVGVVAVAAAWTYTGGPRPYGYVGLGEAFVFAFFGLVATVGTSYAVGDVRGAAAWWGGTAVGAWACALLAVNNARDRATDEAAGKRTLAVRLGDRGARGWYVALLLAGFAGVAVVGTIVPTALLGLLALPLAVGPVRTVLGGASGPRLVDALGATARVHLVGGLLLAAGIALG